MTQIEFNKIKDDLMMDGVVFQKTTCIGETLMNQGMNYPYMCSTVTEDAIHSNNGKNIWLVLNKFAKRLSLKLDNNVQSDEDRFTMHFGFNMTAIGHGEVHKYIPFTLGLTDGQVLTALVRNQDERGKKFNPAKDVVVTKWILNNKDITPLVYKNGDTSIDMATTVLRLKSMIEGVHKRFVSKNPTAAKTNQALVSEINAMTIDLSDNKVVFVKGKDEPTTKNTVTVADLPKEYTLEEILDNDPLGLLDEPNQNANIGIEDITKEVKSIIDEKINNSDAIKGTIETNPTYFEKMVTSEVAKLVKKYNVNIMVGTIKTLGAKIANEYQEKSYAKKLEDMEERKNPSFSVGDYVKVNSGYDNFHYGQITKDYTDETMYTGDKNGYEVTGLGDLIKPEQMVKIAKEEFEANQEEEETPTTNPDDMYNEEVLSLFISEEQLKEMASDELKDAKAEIIKTIETMPKTYETDGQGDNALAYLHYFTSNSDWYITERDKEDEQIQAFGYASLNGQDGELGYISIEELKSIGAELDLYYTPQTLKEIKGKTNKGNALTPYEQYIDDLESGETTEEEVKDIINEATMDMTKEQVQALSDFDFEHRGGLLTDQNYHSEKVLFDAKRTGNDDSIKEANDIVEQHNEEGSLSGELNERRKKLALKIKATLLGAYEPEKHKQDDNKYNIALAKILSTPKENIADVIEDIQMIEDAYSENPDDEILGGINEQIEEYLNTMDSVNEDALYFQNIQDEYPESKVREFGNYKNWAKAVKQIDHNADFTGDEDIDGAFKKGEYEAEWDGEKGYVVDLTKTKANNIEEDEIDMDGFSKDENISPKKLATIIKNTQKALLLKARAKGLYENFGQKEVGGLTDNYIDSSSYTDEQNAKRKMIDDFNEWAMNVNDRDISKDNIEEDAISLPSIKINDHQRSQMTEMGQFEVEISTYGDITFEDKVVGKYNKATGKVTIVGKKDFTNPLVAWLSDNSFFSNETAISLKDKAYYSNKPYYKLEGDEYKLDSVSEDGIKVYHEQNNIGKSKYVISYHDGESKHKDNSDFYDIATFSNKKEKDDFIKALIKDGYKEKGSATTQDMASFKRGRYTPNKTEARAYAQKMEEIAGKYDFKSSCGAIRKGCKVEFVKVDSDLNDEVISGEVVNESYGDKTEQHTFTIKTDDGRKVLVKGRNLYPRLLKHEQGEISKEVS